MKREHVAIPEEEDHIVIDEIEPLPDRRASQFASPSIRQNQFYQTTQRNLATKLRTEVKKFISDEQTYGMGPKTWAVRQQAMMNRMDTLEKKMKAQDGIIKQQRQRMGYLKTENDRLHDRLESLEEAGSKAHMDIFV
jgi:hypothetical protein